MFIILTMVMDLFAPTVLTIAEKKYGYSVNHQVMTPRRGISAESAAAVIVNKQYYYLILMNSTSHEDTPPAY